MGATTATEVQVFDLGGRCERRELDRNSDGDADQITIYRRDAASRVVRVEIRELVGAGPDVAKLYRRDNAGRVMRWVLREGDTTTATQTFRYDDDGDLAESRFTQFGIHPHERHEICEYDDVGRALRFGVDWDGDGSIDVERRDDCEPAETEPDVP